MRRGWMVANAVLNLSMRMFIWNGLKCWLMAATMFERGCGKYSIRLNPSLCSYSEPVVTAVISSRCFGGISNCFGFCLGSVKLVITGFALDGVSTDFVVLGFAPLPPSPVIFAQLRVVALSPLLRQFFAVGLAARSPLTWPYWTSSGTPSHGLLPISVVRLDAVFTDSPLEIFYSLSSPPHRLSFCSKR